MDLKPDNICIGTNNVNSEESSSIFLIDFGISKAYLDDYGKHIEKGPNVIFQGNIMYASENAFR